MNRIDKRLEKEAQPPSPTKKSNDESRKLLDAIAIPHQELLNVERKFFLTKINFILALKGKVDVIKTFSTEDLKVYLSFAVDPDLKNPIIKFQEVSFDELNRIMHSNRQPLWSGESVYDYYNATESLRVDVKKTFGSLEVLGELSKDKNDHFFIKIK